MITQGCFAERCMNDWNLQGGVLKAVSEGCVGGGS